MPTRSIQATLESWSNARLLSTFQQLHSANSYLIDMLNRYSCSADGP